MATSNFCKYNRIPFLHSVADSKTFRWSLIPIPFKHEPQQAFTFKLYEPLIPVSCLIVILLRHRHSHTISKAPRFWHTQHHVARVFVTISGLLVRTSDMYYIHPKRERIFTPGTYIQVDMRQSPEQFHKYERGAGFGLKRAKR